MGGGEFNNVDTFSWVYRSSTANGTRTATTHKNNGAYGHQKLRQDHSAAIMTAKRVIATEERDKGQGTAEQKSCDAMYAHRMEDLLGACWQDLYLKGMDVVYCNGELGPRIVIKQENGLVRW